ncbi:MAG: DUF378 domain-containing protein [bacterium]|nr:DUF378 domain-containing protein [bacterium]
MKKMHVISCVLLWVGGLNWGLIGLFDFNLVNSIFGTLPVVEKLIYIFVGVSAVYIAAMHKSDCKMCVSAKVS